MAIAVAGLIVGLRSRLGDVDVLKHKYSQPELIDAINSALAHVSEELLCFTRTWVIPCVDGVGRYKLPNDFLRFISVEYNGTLISDVVSMERRANEVTTCCGKSVSFDLQTLHLSPHSDIKESDVVTLYYHSFESVSDERESISLPNNAKESLLYFALGLLFENNISAKGIEKSNRYKKLYELEIEKIRSRVRKNAQSKHIISTFIKV